MNKKNQIVYLISGTIWMIIGIVLFIYRQEAILRISKFFGIVVSINGFWLLLKSFVPSDEQSDFKQRLILWGEAIITIVLGIWIINRSQLTTKWLVIGIGIYQLFIGLATLISYWLMRLDRVKGRLAHLLVALINIVWGITSVLTASQPTNNTAIQRLSIYLIFYGLTIFLDGRDYLMSEPTKNKMKRRIRITVPVLFNVFAPKKVLNKINAFLNEELDLKVPYSEFTGSHPTPTVLKVFIHVGDHGTETMGHVDLSYKGKIYAYGNYDVDSERLFGAIGDGIFFSLDETDYIEHCLLDEMTMFEFQVALSEQQEKEFEEQLNELHRWMYPWVPQTQKQKNSYIGQLAFRYDANLYKFSSSRFKTYFVLGTNCVLLADQLIGASGLDLIAMAGIMTPGTYYDYFEQEYKKPHSIVVGKKVHHRQLY